MSNMNGILLLLLFRGMLSSSTQTIDERYQKAKTALEYVERVRTSSCNGGTEETLPVSFDHRIWAEYAHVAIKMANLLTKIVITNSNKLDTTEKFLFDLVRNNVDNDSPIFGSAIAVEEWVYPKFKTFCPYSYKKKGVFAHDISLNYNYLSNATEWYHTLRFKNWTSARVSVNEVTYRHNSTSHSAKKLIYQPMSVMEYGHWTAPYYDCGGGDIWMVTYSSPIFGFKPNNIPFFRGIATIDIELTNIDINQCDLEDNPTRTTSSSVDVFRGTHNCPLSTTCVPILGQGFIRGAYKCVCSVGYYFPDISASVKSYNGSSIEEALANATSITQFQCKKCAEGCETCIDDSPCLYSFVLPIRVALLVLVVILFASVICLSAGISIFRNTRAIKSASPLFLHFMAVGSALMCTSTLFTYPEPTWATCVSAMWTEHIGFALAYGALLLKTWRISAIFTVKSAKKLNLSDRKLARGFIPIVLFATIFLAVWTGVGKPEVIWSKTSSDLKFKSCDYGFWEYIAIVVEFCFLLWGVYLCYIVRKAPSHFNESKYITWSIYNNVILGTFMIIIERFIAFQRGPDIIYLCRWIHLQVAVTGMLTLICIPKFYAIVSKKKDDAINNDNFTITGRTVGPMVSAPTDVFEAGKPLRDVSTQTESCLIKVCNSTTDNFKLPLPAN
ncbi:DgyrCDS11550 [Dimorphilus gyrociliatus]|uniref:DgyrCDS11550 n=1 Tax=Dimorphilus gyrociliatus TaxID=2664684 RepID=A0A7I8W3X4_9ANNE|nr:DgyrCDS11550 [Dimorphilus gyrociliatus]